MNLMKDLIKKDIMLLIFMPRRLGKLRGLVEARRARREAAMGRWMCCRVGGRLLTGLLGVWVTGES